ncbi:MAG: LamG-like jellyroll fold domain-containing protein [Verrucomicrobiota bacterium]
MNTKTIFLAAAMLAALSLLSLRALADDTNIAEGKPVKASGPVSGAASLVTDGDPNTLSKPSGSAAGFYYQVDLGKEYPLEAIELYAAINCCPNQLSRVRMGVYADNDGVPGVENWGYVIRPNNAANAQGSVDTLTAGLHPDGVFRGRFIRLTNTAATAGTPYFGEIQVFEASAPEVRFFGPDAGNITKTGNPALPAQSTLSWNISGATSVTLDQGIGEVDKNSGSVVVSPAVSTTYTLTARTKVASVTKSVTIGVDQTELPPTISEFLATNTKGLQDRAGGRPDWIEIANPNAFAINVKDYYLTDSATNRTKWRFPSFAVPGHGYAVVFADGIGAEDPLDIPHARFSLSAAGEYLGLVARDGTTVLSQFPRNYPAATAYPAQSPDHSYGEAGGQTGYFLPPTPGEANGPVYEGVVQDLVFSAGRGFYNAPQSVTITTPTPGAEIRYTTNGSEPTATAGTVYTGPVDVSASRVLRVAAFKPGWAPTVPVTQTYLLPAATIAATTPWTAPASAMTTYRPQLPDALKQVPSMSLTVGPVTINGGIEKVGALEWIDPAGGPGFMIPCGAKLFGGSYTDFAKKSYRVSFRSEYGEGKLRFPLFAGYERGWAPAEEFDSLELRNGSHDMLERGFYMSNIFTDATMLDMGAFAPHGRFVHLYLNGVYWGLYHLRERWGASMLSTYYGGPKEAYESVNGNLNVGGWADPAPAYDGTGEAWARILALARSGSGNYQALRPYLDVQQYIDYMIMFMFGDSEDEYRASGPAGAGSGFKFILNDADGYLRNSAGDRTGRSAPGRANGDGPGSIFSLLYKGADADYRVLLADRIQKAFISPGGAMTPARNIARLNELHGTIDKALVAECARWNYRTPANWLSSKNAIVSSWFPARTNTVLGYYRSTGFYPATAAPVASPLPGTVTAGTSVSLTTATAGSTIHYTTDGSDPRVSVESTFNIPLVTSATQGKFRVPATADEGLEAGSIPNLAGYWPFDGTAADATGSFPGTPAGDPAFTAGRYGSGAVQLNGTSQYISLGDPEGLKITGQITLAAWVKADAVSGIRNIVNKGHDPTGTPNGEITLRIVDGSYQGGYWAGDSTAMATGPATGEGSAAADIGVWTHLAIVYDGSNWRLYRNGTQIAQTVSGTGAVTVPAVGWAIGARGTGTERFFSGAIDEVGIFSRGLTPAEITAVYNNNLTAPAAAWARPAYNDSAWTPASGVLGFAPAISQLAPLIRQHTGAAMQGVSATGYLRLPFSLTAQEKTGISRLQLRIRGDDGYAVWLNGTRIVGRNAPAALTGASTATASTPDATTLNGETLDVSTAIPYLATGGNVLAVQGLNISPSDGDFLLSATLSAGDGPTGVSPQAVTYTTAPVLTQSTILSARALTTATNRWSALLQVFYQVGPQPCPAGAVVISELNYNPPDDGDGEFMELMNVSDAAVNLRGATFTKGITFTFPANRDTLLAPGGRLVLVDSEYTFQQIQGWSAPLGGVYSGNLSNEGEQITLTSADGTLAILDMTYGVTDPWPAAADSTGHSLVLIQPHAGQNLSDANHWRPSLTANGNPNTTDALAFTGNPATDADGDGLTALMEFALGTSDLVPDKNPVPLPVLNPATGLRDVTVEHALGTDGAPLEMEASADLRLWNIPSELKNRTLLPDGRLQSTWSVPGNLPRLFLRLHAGAP